MTDLLKPVVRLVMANGTVRYRMANGLFIDREPRWAASRYTIWLPGGNPQGFALQVGFADTLKTAMLNAAAAIVEAGAP